MGKKTRKTRWRTLAIGDEQSDSEESNSTLDTRVPPTYHQKYYNRFTYSSQSTPTRRYQSDSNKSTRSSSTASENKITFNEDEYTRITTPRQDVLFKKGYLNKPKTYSTQTSTGNSSTSTGNSTGNGTPEYQSTDLEYESQFMFPNGFLDQNGIYYVNSYEPYPLMVYNAPTTYYNNDSCERSKKYSTESLADTASTSNEETSQETANYNGVGHGEEIQQTTPPQQVNGHHPQPHMPPAADYGQVYNVVYPGFYYNGLCPPQELVNCQNHNLEQPKRIKRRRRRKFPDSEMTGDQMQNGNASEYTEDEFSSVEEEEEPANDERPASEDPPSPDHSTSVSPPTENQTNENSEAEASSPDAMDVPCDSNDTAAASDVNCDTEKPPVVEDGAHCNDTSDNSTVDENQEEKKVKYDLKPDAQEFVPRALRPENLQYFKIQPGFVPIPMMSPMGAPPYGHPAYLPHGMPLGYIQQNPAMYPGFVPGYIPAFNPESIQTPIGATVNEITPMDVAPDHQQESRNKNDIDINTVVSKLEEVANDSQKPDKRNASPYKKPRNYEDRKKFFHKNNNNQSGFYQKKTNVKYQTINNSVANPSSNLHKDDSNDTKECSKIIEEPILECPQEEHVNTVAVPEILPESKDPPLQPDTPNEQKEVSQSSMKSKSNEDVTSPKLPEVIPKEKAMDVEKPINSPKFQQRPTNSNKSETPKTPNKDNNYSDPRMRWPRREEKNFQRWDQGEERSNQGYKQNNSPNYRFNQKFTPNSPARKQNGVQTNHHYNDNTKKYSETVKKTQSIASKPVIRENTTKTFNEIKPVIPEVTNTPTNKTQWISVSNKKKRRNKNIEDNTNGSETPIEEKEEEEKKPEPSVVGIEDFQQNAFLQNIINGHSKVEESEKIESVSDIIRKSPVKILEVRDLEKELLSNVGVEIKEENDSLIAEVKIIEPTKQKLSSKKKSKKGSQKQTTKRVFITDLDLSGLNPGGKQEEQKEDLEESGEIVEGIEKIATDETQNVESKVDIVTEVEEEVVIEKEFSEKEVPKQEVIPLEQTEKKSKKKKKKSKSVETTASTPTNSENTYDFLLENTLSNNSDDKTNMEISQELDLIIQRGMYNSLEEKIKALNIIPIKEEFFQSVVRSSRESSTEKTPEFTKLLANSMPKFKYCMASVEDETPKTMIDLSQPSTSRNDLFVENPEVNELLKDIYGKEGTPEAEIGELITRLSPPKEIIVERVKEESVERKLNKTQENNEPDKEKLYPITQAVKNWMSKTRENTPEVEILKSPSKIFKEFCDMDDSTRNVLTNGKRNSAISESDDEVTVYSASRNNSGAADLLDCWENEISLDSNGRTSIENTESKGNSDTNEDEEVLEVYESKYGQNEDFLELQREIEEKKKQEQDARSRNFPKHGALPYRAICCNVM
ncbi:uncharacterized protein LOC123676920 [Harmonia axyridis]|uniref:uncharacterized protein LOC123676920 n=1 Tax=Harmonia axyridis TaxID=115357 RepID=UPI001E27729D|nr:uncharacterized protein LOC123676920 [Harmonia axyridis]